MSFNLDPNCVMVRIPDASTFGIDNVVDPIRQPYDFIGQYFGRPLAIETKTTKLDSFKLSALGRRRHQLDALERFASCHPMAIAGMIIAFVVGESASIMFVPWERLIEGGRIAPRDFPTFDKAGVTPQNLFQGAMK